MSNLIILVGPPGSGKSTLAQSLINNDGDLGAATAYVNQDSQGKGGHMEAFNRALDSNKDIIVDRMNFSWEQRARYIKPAKEKGYTVKIIVLHESWKTCFERMSDRKNHPTITEEAHARAALHTFFSQYQSPGTDEADAIELRYPPGEKAIAVLCDLDGTLCNIEERRKHLNREEGKKPNWRAFFADMKNDLVNIWCRDILYRFQDTHHIVFCSGRPKDYEAATSTWLKNNLPDLESSHLFMRAAGDHRQDYIVKEILLDFEILTRFTPYFVIDDRTQVVEMWRRRGIVCLQCDLGDF